MGQGGWGWDWGTGTACGNCCCGGSPFELLVAEGGRAGPRGQGAWGAGCGGAASLLLWNRPRIQSRMVLSGASGGVVGLGNGKLVEWQSLLVVVGWAAVSLVGGLLIARRRDV